MFCMLLIPRSLVLPSLPAQVHGDGKHTLDVMRMSCQNFSVMAHIVE